MRMQNHLWYVYEATDENTVHFSVIIMGTS